MKKGKKIRIGIRAIVLIVIMVGIVTAMVTLSVRNILGSKAQEWQQGSFSGFRMFSDFTGKNLTSEQSQNIENVMEQFKGMSENGSFDPKGFQEALDVFKTMNQGNGANRLSQGNLKSLFEMLGNGKTSLSRTDLKNLDCSKITELKNKLDQAVAAMENSCSKVKTTK